MEKYNAIIEAAIKMQATLNSMKETIKKAQTKDIIDARIFLLETNLYDKIESCVDKLKSVADRVINCKNDDERLDCLLEEMYFVDLYDEDTIENPC